MRLLFNMCAIPVALFITSYFLLSIGYRFGESQYLNGLSIYLVYGSYLAAAAALVLALYSLWRVGRAYQGKGENLCDCCGMPTRHHPNGRYGPYFKCWSCGTNRADR